MRGGSTTPQRETPTSRHSDAIAKERAAKDACVVRDAVPALRDRAIHLYYLPPYSPHLNAIEPVLRVLKHHEMPERRYTTLTDLRADVTAAFTTYEEALIRKHHIHPGLAT